MEKLYKCVRPILFKISPETAHNFATFALSHFPFPYGKAFEDPILKVTLWERNFPNPTGIAAGFDKNAEIIAPCFKFGFGFTETGTVTPKPQAGNPKPRIFRNPRTLSAINRMGFPNIGLKSFKANITRFIERKPRPQGIVGINISINKEQTNPIKDYVPLVRHLGPLADFLVVNVSSPNTPGLRDLQKIEHLGPLLDAIIKERDKSCRASAPPLLVKLAPDIEDKDKEGIAEILLQSGIDGLVLTNTTYDRPEHLDPSFASETGGLSGEPIKEKSTRFIRDFYRLTQGKLPIIGVGGIASGKDAYEKIKAGASLIELYTAMVYEGPWIVNKINKELAALLKADGYNSISDAVGADHGT